MTDISAAPSPVNFRHAAFLQSASAVENAPPDAGWEVAFAGRSNSGKSSAINALTEQGKLARTSRTPGRTQLINFFALSDSQRLVDLPGYGFAKVPLAVKKKEDGAAHNLSVAERSFRMLDLLFLPDEMEAECECDAEGSTTEEADTYETHTLQLQRKLQRIWAHYAMSRL